MCRVWCGVSLSSCGGERPNGTSGRKGRHALRPSLSTIMRLPSGAVASRGIPFRRVRSASGPFSATVGTGALRVPARRHSAPACPSGVGWRVHPRMRGAGLGRDTSRRPSPPPARCPRHPAVRARSGPVAGAPSRSRTKGAVSYGASGGRLRLPVSKVVLNQAQGAFVRRLLLP